MTQQSLFDMRPPARDPARGPARFTPPAKPPEHLARPTDPGTSHLAARHPDLAVRREEHFAAILEAVAKHPGLTAQELADHCALTNEQIHRRIKEMVDAGLLARPAARICTKTHRYALVIYARARALHRTKGGSNA